MCTLQTGKTEKKWLLICLVLNNFLSTIKDPGSHFQSQSEGRWARQHRYIVHFLQHRLWLPAANHKLHTFLQEPWILSIMPILNGLLLHISMGENAFMHASNSMCWGQGKDLRATFIIYHYLFHLDLGSCECSINPTPQIFLSMLGASRTAACDWWRQLFTQGNHANVSLSKTTTTLLKSGHVYFQSAAVGFLWRNVGKRRWQRKQITLKWQLYPPQIQFGLILLRLTYKLLN